MAYRGSGRKRGDVTYAYVYVLELFCSFWLKAMQQELSL